MSHAAQAPLGDTVYADSGSKITSTVAAVNLSTVACDYCLFQAPGSSSFTNLYSGGSALSPGNSSVSGGSSLSGGAIAGVVIGALGGVALVAGLAWLLLRRRRKDEGIDKPEKLLDADVDNRPSPGADLCDALSTTDLPQS